MKKFALAGLVIGSALLVSSAAWAIDLTKPVKTIDGEDFTDQTGRPLPLTLARVIEGALYNDIASNEDTKTKNYWLAVEVHNHAADFSFTPDQIIQIRKSLANTQTTAIFGQVMSSIDPTWAPKK